MLTVIVLGEADPLALAATFRSLMPGVIAGIVAEVRVVAAEDGAVREICERMGARLVQKERALEGASSNWLLLLRAGAVPRSEWAQAVLDHVSRSDGSARFETKESTSLWRRLTGQVGDPLRPGLLIERRKAEAASRTAPLDQLSVGRAVATLPAGIRPAGDD